MEFTSYQLYIEIVELVYCFIFVASDFGFFILMTRFCTIVFHFKLYLNRILYKLAE